MQFIVIAGPMLILLFFFGIFSVAALRQSRQDRRNIMAHGVSSLATVTRIEADLKDGRCLLHFRFQSNGAGGTIDGKQRTTRAALSALALEVGSIVEVHYLIKRTAWAFIDSLVRAEYKVSAPNGSMLDPAQTSLFYVSFIAPNSFRWSGNGELAILGNIIRFTALRREPFWFPKRFQREFALSLIADVEHSDNRIRLRILPTGQKPQVLTLRAVNEAEAAAIAASLPSERTQGFVPAFDANLLLVTPARR
jgi:hypothetical protein